MGGLILRKFLAAIAAEPVYRLFGKRIETKVMPDPGEAILHDVGYYMHAGGHGTLLVIMTSLLSL